MWQPSASILVLKQRAQILEKIRLFFAARQVLEVDVPVLGEAGVTDPFLDALMVEQEALYLQTSPEYFMKRLLASGSGDIYYLGKAFRKDESGRIHHHEFTMLEWYRLGFDDHQLMHELACLVHALKPDIPYKKISYEQLFLDVLDINPHTASCHDLSVLAKSRLDIQWDDERKSTWLDLLFTHLIEPTLVGGLFAVYDYPSCQSALAKLALDDRGFKVARRFEFYLNGVELANGYWELTDAEEQMTRFTEDNALRNLLGKKEMPIDQDFVDAVEFGLPACAGVALGVDRLVMALLNLSSIDRQRSF